MGNTLFQLGWRSLTEESYPDDPSRLPDMEAFDAKVKSIASRFEKLTFKYTGPWPPYNFVNIRLKLERA